MTSSYDDLETHVVATRRPGCVQRVLQRHLHTLIQELRFLDGFLSRFLHQVLDYLPPDTPSGLRETRHE